ncbi:MAG: hypothetical protein KDE26_19995 [Bacteroidetes bacterium]|nr:hypothetical protein [Bacteroidota bacterium]MCB0845547.1 hypothetical protein [Bacteroidota bacterium]
MLENIFDNCPSAPDLTNPDHLALVKEKVSLILSHTDDISQLDALEKEWIQSKDETTILVLLALKIARSKLIVKNIKEETKVSIVFAVYKENNRILTSEEHEHGEDFLRQKAAQLSDLFDEYPHLSWELVIVDDGCPEGSGKIAREIAAKEGLEDRVRVLFLEEAIAEGLEVTAPMTSTKDSMKGGAITYGMWDAATHSQHDNHIIVFTDADLSTHLGQVGLLMDSIINEGKNVCVASRREGNSVVIKKGSRNDRGKLFIYLWKHMVPNLSYIIDTQCGFKAFKKETVLHIVNDMIEKKFAFDIELLLKSELQQTDSIEKVGVAWIDSEAASTTTDLQPYIWMLKAIAQMYKKYLPANPQSDEIAQFILDLSKEEFDQLLDNIPTAITDREPVEFNEFKGVSAEDLRMAIQAVQV